MKKPHKIPLIKWETRVLHVDMSTGEYIPITEINNYRILQTKKFTHVKKTRGTIEITNICGRNEYRQQELPFN